MGITERLIELSNELATKKASLQEEMKIVFKETVSNLFNEFPEVGMICWNQYTPYFNDGDPCVFSVNEVYFVPKSDEEGREIDLNLSVYTYNEFHFVEKGSYAANKKLEGITYYQGIQIASDELSKALEEVCSFIQTNDDLMLDLFGDHVTIRLLPDEIIIEEYDHD